MDKNLERQKAQLQAALDKRKAKAIAMREQGHTFEYIAEALGVSRQRAAIICKPGAKA